MKKVAGAGIYVADIHAMMGDGEIAGHTSGRPSRGIGRRMAQFGPRAGGPAAELVGEWPSLGLERAAQAAELVGEWPSLGLGRPAQPRNWPENVPVISLWYFF
jgi:hypothetical protein